MEWSLPILCCILSKHLVELMVMTSQAVSECALPMELTLVTEMQQYSVVHTLSCEL